jgi:hypothetical protein
LTDFVREIGQVLQPIEKQRGRSLTLILRVASPERALTTAGVDLRQWIGEKLAPILIVSELQNNNAFRRAESVYEAARFKLRGLDPGAEYVLTNLDSGQSQTLAGRELLDKGLAVPIADQPGSAVIVYKKAK